MAMHGCRTFSRRCPPTPRPSSTQAYRRMALVKHPDKAKTPNAAAEFAELQRAYAVLTNPDARGALDDYIGWAGTRPGGRAWRSPAWRARDCDQRHLCGDCRSSRSAAAAALPPTPPHPHAHPAQPPCPPARLPIPSAKAAREARYAAQDSKRRKMREDLEQRERTAVREQTAEQKARARLKVRCSARGRARPPMRGMAPGDCWLPGGR